MDEANDSQGLKIALAAFISLSTILMVTSYFLYSNAATVTANLEFERRALKQARDDLKKTRDLADVTLRQYHEMRTRIGTKAEDFDPAMAEITASFEKVDGRLNTLMSAVNTAVQTAQKDGAWGQALEDARLNVQKAIAICLSEPDKSYISSLDRLTEVMENMATLTTQLSREYVAARKKIEQTTGVNR